MSLPLLRLNCLDQLRGFVAVGRRMSITLAAQDLCVTQSAVSRQVALLEDTLGTKLLVRGHRSVSFTPEGERLFHAADGALQQLQDAFGALLAPGERRPVALTTSASVAALWLLPRLGRFHAQHPGIELRLSSSNAVLDLRAERMDLAIRYGLPAAMPAGAVRLFRERVLPVARPGLVPPGTALAEALTTQVLIELDDPRLPWLQWDDRLAALGLSERRRKGMLRLSQYDQVVHAALQGQGIALGRQALVQPLIDAGQLVVLGDDPADAVSERGHWLVQADSNPRADVRAVAQWITEEAQAEAGDAPGAASAAPTS
jgi:DNA-binding transcriptional LysR family regulator